MPEQERARLKEQFIKEFRERKQIRRSLESAHQRQTVNQALADMVNTLEETVDPVDEYTARLDAETALNEARLEIALESQTPEDPNRPSKVSSVQDEPPNDSTAKTIGPRLRTDASDKGE